MMEVLEYKSWASFSHIVEQVVKTMVTVGIPFYENVIYVEKESGSKEDFKLSRFACFLLVMQADHTKEAVADAQSRFIRKVEQFGITKKELIQLERFKIREEIADANKWLNSAAARRALKDFRAFSEAGYLGMYDMDSKKLHEFKNVPENRSLQDTMGNVELALHLLRIELTEETIWIKKIAQQVPLEDIHYKIARELRDLIKKHLGVYPEELPVLEELHDLKRDLRKSYELINSQ